MNRAGYEGLSGRAIVAGLGAGAVLCATSLFVGLKVGFTDSGNVTASILGFALGRGVLRGRSRYSAHENQVSHGLAVSMAVAPSTVGLVTVFPGLSLMDVAWSPWPVALWGGCLALVGIGLAFAWRRALLERAQLPFPTGIAAAELITAMHASAAAGRARTRALLGGAVAGALISGLRDLPPRWLAAVTWVPGSLGGRSCQSLGLGIAWSPMLAGVGALIGLPVALAALAGSLVAWLGCAPRVTAPGAGFDAVVAWTAWPATGLLISASLPSIARALARLRRSHAAGVRLGTVSVVVAPIAVLVPLGSWIFDVPSWVMALGVAVTPVGAMLCAYAAGEIDVSPYGIAGNIAQAGLGRAAGSPMGGLGAGSAVSGVSVQVTSSLWALRAGDRLGTPIRPQLVAQALGALAGVALAIPLYGVLVAAHGGVGGDALPAVAGQSVRAAFRLASEGGGVPASAAAIALGTGAILVAAPTRRWISVAGLGVGMLLPVHYAVAIVAGAALARRGALSDASAAGLIIGETMVAVATAVAQAIG